MFDPFIQALEELEAGSSSGEPSPEEWAKVIALAERMFRAAGVR